MTTPAKPQGGSTANASGRLAEELIQNQLVSIGMGLANKQEHDSARALLNAGFSAYEAMLPNRFYRQLRAFTNIYGSRFKADFILRTVGGKVGLIEMKWQVSAGSVDEKLPFWLRTLQSVPDDVAPMLIVLGDGVRSGAMSWLRNNAGRVRVVSDVKAAQKIIRATWGGP